MICGIHNRYIPEGQVCSDCFSEQHKQRKAEQKKAGKTFGRHRQFEQSEKSKNGKADRPLFECVSEKEAKEYASSL